MRRLGADASGGASGGAAPKSSDPLKIVLGLLLPIVLPIAGLLIFYWQASNQGLGEVLKRLKAKRDRSRKRRGASAGGNFRHRQKLSQDGKGGRSANS